MHKLTQKEVLQGLNLENLDFYLLDTIDSTNRFAKDTKLQKDYLLVLSEEQTAGRGRQGKSWYSPNIGNIYLSFKFKSKNLDVPLSLIMGLLISEAMDEASGIDIHAGLKWPNDLLIKNKKICGILIESEVLNNEIYWVIGIGVNYALPQKEAWWGDIGSLENILPREKLINILVKKIILFINQGYPDWKNQWEARCMHQQAKVTVTQNDQHKEISGVFNGINEEGKMLLKTTTGIECIAAGQCSIKGIY